MRALDRTLGWLTEHAWVPVVLAVVAISVGAAAIGSALLPREGPAVSTAERYAPLEEQRAVRADVYAEPSPPSVLQGAAAPSATPTAVPAPVTHDAPLVRIRIASIGVDAPITVKDVDANGVMESPDGPTDVAWYGFTAKPGVPGNAVLSGHVDYINHGPAVFWDLRELVNGDMLEMILQDGTIIQYAVSATHSYGVEDIPMEEVLATTSAEWVTLITCDGEASGGSYANRLVVRATRIGVVEPA